MEVNFLFNTNSKGDLILNVLKIGIILFISTYLLGNFIPFYEGADSYLYGNVAVNLSKGIFGISNELLEETGKSQFIGTNWLKTVNGDAIPRGSIGLPVIGSIFFTLGGYTGLFYLGPIFGILLIISSERISTNLFGKYCGLLTLLFVSTNHLIFRNSLNLQTESVFAFFALLGTYFIIKFFKIKKERLLLLSSGLFVIATFVRINGAIFLPAEIIIITGALIVAFIGIKYKNKTKSFYSYLYSNIKSPKKIILYVSIPWIIFLIFWFSYYDHFFGDPFTNYRQITETANELAYNADSHRDAKFSSLFNIESKSFENLKGFSSYILPYQFPAVYNKLGNNFENILGSNWIGFLAIVGLASSILWSMYSKNKRIEFTIFFIMILSSIWFYASVTTEERASYGYQGRYMIGTFILFSMMISYITIKFLKIKIDNIKNILKIILKSFKILLVIGLFGFFVISFYNATPIQTSINNELEFKNPIEISKKYPLNLEGLTEKSVIIVNHGDWAIEYGAIPFFLLDKGKLSIQSVELLEKIIEDGYEVYIFKTPTSSSEKKILLELVNNHGFVLKNYSETFCKVVSNQNNVKTDMICLKKIDGNGEK